MAIAFREDHGHADRSRMIKVHVPKADRPIHVVIGNNEIYWRTVAMHWDRELGRLVPCLTSKCTYCPSPTREVTYVPCLLAEGNVPRPKFSLRILPVTDGWSDILSADHNDSLYKIARKQKSEACHWSIAGKISAFGITPFAGQEIEMSLRRMWGVKDNSASQS